MMGYTIVSIGNERIYLVEIIESIDLVFRTKGGKMSSGVRKMVLLKMETER